MNNGFAGRIQAGNLKSGKLKTGNKLFVPQKKRAAERHVGAPSSAMFVEDCPFQNTSSTVAFFVKPTKTIQVRIGIKYNQLDTRICLFKTISSLNVISKTLFSEGMVNMDLESVSTNNYVARKKSCTNPRYNSPFCTHVTFQSFGWNSAKSGCRRASRHAV